MTVVALAAVAAVFPVGIGIGLVIGYHLALARFSKSQSCHGNRTT